MARTAEALRRLSMQFQNRQVDKRYVALVDGHPDKESGEIDLPLICDWPNRPRQIVDYERGKPSFTKWQIDERFEDHTRVILYPKTGRSHQLRVHMQALGHPILGDSFYAPDHAYHAANRLMLHAEWIEFHHPDKGERTSFEAPPPF